MEIDCLWVVVIPMLAEPFHTLLLGFGEMLERTILRFSCFEGQASLLQLLAVNIVI